jgi:transcriptional regulator GlxA family with amidase domain
MMNKRKVAILLFNEVEVLDFAGPYEVFANARQDGDALYDVFTVGEKAEMISARYGLKVTPEYDFHSAPDADIVVVQGGYGAEHIEIKNPVVLGWIRAQKAKAAIISSVCTGAFLLAEAGLLNGLRATTHWLDYDRLEEEYPDISVIRNQKYIDQGTIITAGGISAGITMALHIVKRLSGEKVAADTARRMEFAFE